MAEYHKGYNILVHCMAGMQRSAACVAFLLIAVEGMHGLDAMQFIKQRRPIAFYPNANFGRSIDYFDREFHSNILPVLRRNQGKW
jgi:protein-tyrosine phosphatase